MSNACEVKDTGYELLPAPLRRAVDGMDDRRTELALTSGLAAAAHHGALHPDTAVVYATGLTSVSVRELEQDCAPFLNEAGDFDYDAFGQTAPAADAQAPTRHQVARPAALLAHHLGLHGPTAAHFSACAAGTAAIGHGLDILRRGEAPMVLVGGSDSMVHPFGMLPFILLGATSTEADPERCGRPFEADRDGFVMGEGGAFFVLERLSTARSAGRQPLAYVRGWGSSTDAYNVTAPHPEGAGAQRAMQAALDDAGLTPDRVHYVNAHGTGTALNDGIEAAAIRATFGETPPPVSSCKAQFGHAIAAAGSLEALAVLAALRDQTLPPNAHLTAPDPSLGLDLVGQTGRSAAVEVALSNSFGFGGQNACLCLQIYSD